MSLRSVVVCNVCDEQLTNPFIAPSPHEAEAMGTHPINFDMLCQRCVTDGWVLSQEGVSYKR